MYHRIYKHKSLTIVALFMVGAIFMRFLMPHLNSLATSVQPGRSIPNAPAGGWPRYMFSDTHQGNNPNETRISATNVASLTVKWNFTQATGPLVGEPIVVNGVVYVGSWDGFLYAIRAKTGVLLWKTNLGTYSMNLCRARGGPSGAPVFDNGMVFIGSGPNFYALNASTGAIVWQELLGTSGTLADHLWGSAAVANGKVFVGVASLCDHPLTQGILYGLNEATGHIDAQANIVPDGQIGGGVWSTPTIDAATSTVIITTGSVDKSAPMPMESSVVTLDWNTLAVKQFWMVSTSQRIQDADWGSTPTLFPGPNGKTYFGCVNKNSIYYVFDEANVSAGPIWEQQLGPGGSASGNKGGVEASVASSAYVNGILYIPSALATVNGASFPGSIGAFDALTGQQLWRFGTPGTIMGSVITANGLLYDGQGNTLEVRDQRTGNVLFSFSIHNSTAAIRGSVTVLNGVVYLPTYGDQLLAFAPHS